MQIAELHNEEMCALFAPDGQWQGMTLAPDMPTCLAIIKMLHKAKMGKSYNQLSMEGFKILPIKIDMVQDGTEEDLLQRAKMKFN